MLTEGWDANTVTHVLGVRAFGTQLLCEQVIGRALRRQSYELNEEGLFNVEYADVLGIPFDFTAKPVVVAAAAARDDPVEAVRPDRDALEIRFPRVEGYRVELPDRAADSKVHRESVLELTPELVGPSVTRPRHHRRSRQSHLPISRICGRRRSCSILRGGSSSPNSRDPGEDPKLYLFNQLKRIAREWLDGGYLHCTGGTYPAPLMYKEIADRACERIAPRITPSLVGGTRSRR